MILVERVSPLLPKEPLKHKRFKQQEEAAKHRPRCPLAPSGVVGSAEGLDRSQLAKRMVRTHV